MRRLASISTMLILAVSGCSPWSPLERCHSALNWLIPLEAGQYESPAFETKFGNIRYHVGLVVERGTLPLTQINCYLGLGQLPDCANDPVQIDMRWRILADNEAVAFGRQQGKANGGGTSLATVERNLTGTVASWPNAHKSFDAVQGKKYRMQLTLFQPGRLLAPGRPSVQIHTCYNPMGME